ncbi:uncharacterized protein TRIVIDRAFT_68171 [Trichoderma virens Gv29-8]|uniref:ribonuclease H n=1 Tax=Hypocrea virens (strain Gv29-8 / FGSC 10586) TaxID=413071 RepID=G9N0G2_HYPVG|nr:uncharacterized protein TRIVIDRAFT_68171 [Trichoderma virens Gv29-8]EHK19844.1 hypothetical protein TRIVIDRAFT_68171 [Trichoderma virens Gv29-8]
MGGNAHHAARTRDFTVNRKFEPSSRYRDDIYLDDVAISTYDERWTYVACENDRPCSDCGSLSPHLNCIIIAVDGACKGNGKPGARASVGVFVGNESEYNKSVLLSESNATNQVAELQAGILALHQAMKIRDIGLDGEELHEVVIKADSEYLVKGMTEWIFKWKANGYRTSKGTPVTNSALFQKLEELVGDLNASDVEVLFWHVPRSQNTRADELANKAL